MLRIGLTGGIGSGKTTVANHFSSLGIDIIDADDIVHRISAPGQQSYEAIAKHFGDEILNADGSLNRQCLSDKIFNNNTALKELEAILHPAVRSAMKHAINKVQSPYCILVIPLLVETGFVDLVDRVLVITATKEKKITWVKQRNGLSREKIESIMSAQASDEERVKIADDIIENSSSVELLMQHVEQLDKKYKNLIGTMLQLKT